MSRAGTRAGRIVRLIRLVRLLRVVKLYKKTEPGLSHPGYDWEDSLDDSEDHVLKESAVSKKLSDLTTRKVILMVLCILICMPFFQAEMYKEELEVSSVYGANLVFRRWCLDMRQFQPEASAENRSRYLNSVERELYEDDFRMYIYYHNWFCKPSHYPIVHTSTSFTSFGKLFFVGLSPPWGNKTEFFLPGNRAGRVYDWDSRWGGGTWQISQCSVGQDVQELMTWSKTRSCAKGTIQGISMIQLAEGHVLCPSDIRFQERIVVYPTVSVRGGCDGMIFVFVFDRRSGSRVEASLNAAQTVFICFLLGFFAMNFQGFTNQLVLRPIERMIGKLETIRNSPMTAALLGDAEQQRELQKAALSVREETEMNRKSCFRRFYGWVCYHGRRRALFVRSRYCCKRRSRTAGDAKEPEPMETVVLESTIIKIGSVLALGFGEAGIHLGQRMKGADSSMLNMMMPGERVESIFAYCEVRNFWDVSDVIDENAMIFVNRIASVVHMCFTEFWGSFAKNVGHAFVLCWNVSAHGTAKRAKLAGMSLMALVKIVANISKSSHLSIYRSHAKLVKRLPNYRVRLSMGLHAGTAIATLVGSEFKVDAEYLSEDLVLATRISAVCAEYGMGCMILFTEVVERTLSRSFSAQCRLIDHVKLTDSKEPFKVYTVDLDDLALEVETSKVGERRVSVIGSVQASQRRAQLNEKFAREQKKRMRWEDRFEMSSVFVTDTDIVNMRLKITERFLSQFHMAYLNYEAGEWKIAKDMLEATHFLLGRADGPSSTLLKYIKKHDMRAPQDWPGFRMLPACY
eukprot:TRINITY_DN30633_c0_g1_i2.p1 TRINITY_DN30633_c0_g1~~TRINITY_DN30633_c0_g1_i2.p1  ORF type:complete len:799 (+),score=97.09 TRINITY_DN30633_c0_g1_i2:517-2913(+)